MQYVVRNVSIVNRLTHGVVVIQVVVFVKSGRKQECFGAWYGTQLLLIRFIFVFQMVCFVVEFEGIWLVGNVIHTWCDAHYHLKRFSWCALFLFAFTHKEHIHLSLEQITQLFCQINPRTKYTKRMCCILFEVFQHRIEHNVRLTCATWKLQFQRRFVAR